MIFFADGIKHTAVIFRSKQICQKVLRKCTYELRYDATFESAPKLFYQVFNVMATFRGASFLVWTVLMTSKKAQLYTIVLAAFKAEYPNVKPKVIQCDFEASLCLAAKLVYPETRVAGCLMHYASAHYKQMKRRGLLKHMSGNSKVEAILRRVMCLPILPASKICEQVDLLYSSAIEQVEDDVASDLLRTYFDEYVIGFWIRKIGPARMSVYGCGQKTNNATEVLHAQMHAKLSRGSITCRYVHRLGIHIFRPAEHKVNQLERGRRIGFPQKKSVKKNQQ